MEGKVGLCIVYKNYNYGSILQSYATLLRLEELGIEYEIIRYNPVKNVRFYLKALPRLLNKDMAYSKMRSLKKKIGLKMHPTFAENEKLRRKKFQEFITEQFTSFSKEIKSYQVLCEYAKDYDAVLVGSDQLWLPAGLATKFYNLMFVPSEVKKIAYAASFGISKIPFYQKKRTKEYLSRIEYISVREHSGQHIIEELTGRNVPVIVDPTLAISKKVWDMHVADEKLVNEEYIFCYFLGGDNLYCRKEAEKLREKTGLKIVTLRHMDEYVEADEKFGDYALYQVGPKEFVNLIRNATYICTDSFHGSVFSIIYHKQFLAFERYKASSGNSRNSRLDSLFQQLGIERRYKQDVYEEMILPINYDLVEKNLSVLRCEAEVYLNHALGIAENKND